ncbi:rubredoxin [Chamaesiphon sp. VAR_48_metabat_135_sub]|uniref:rubredoxin n=1 Tax=Chamaesiphon sp. VAR_48_metabat_135_sub TaxID=2964699 RepID=UPI00286C09A8|nr:rubredoxin [Chamaesiphon sp. VAR_48_metabat_135_sub]
MNDGEQDRLSSPEDLETTTDQKVENTDDDRFECRACGYTYDPNRGDPKNKVIAGTPFSVLPAAWTCPVCTAKKAAFTNIGTNAVSGFKENQGYGFGVNTMTQEQKSLLIYGGLGVGILLLLSLYTLN